VPYSKILDRVTLWDTSPEEAYKKHVLEYFKKSNNEDYRCMYRYHNFSGLVNLFLLSLGLSCDFLGGYNQKEDTLSYNIPGQIIYTITDDNNEEKKLLVDGVFSYGIDKSGALYHRCFASTFNRLDIDTMAKINKRMRRNPYSLKSNLDCDTIQKKEQTNDSAYELKKIEINENEYYEENDYCIKLNDSKHKMQIILFK
jgi:hypothetical protein